MSLPTPTLDEWPRLPALDEARSALEHRMG
jgi:hypothetical protein